MLQAHEEAQSTPISQAPVTVQPTVQGPDPQVMGPRQALLAKQTTSQLVASLQSMPPPQVSLELHSTLHFLPAGQVTSPAQEPEAAHEKTHTSRSQREHTLGQTNASGRGIASGSWGSASMTRASMGASGGRASSGPRGRHQPSMHIRSDGQSELTVQLSSFERRLNVHADAARVGRIRQQRSRRT